VHRKLLGNKVDELIGVCVPDDEGDDPLAEVVIGQTHHGRLGHLGMAEQDGLDLTGADPVATGFDQIHRLAADDAVHPGRVDDGGVAGSVPAVGGE